MNPVFITFLMLFSLNIQAQNDEDIDITVNIDSLKVFYESSGDTSDLYFLVQDLIQSKLNYSPDTVKKRIEKSFIQKEGFVAISCRYSINTDSNLPFIIINGIPQPQYSSSDHEQRHYFDFLNNHFLKDIESFVILKGRTAAAIYGVRALNGVILIQTKSKKWFKWRKKN